LFYDSDTLHIFVSQQNVVVFVVQFGHDGQEAAAAVVAAVVHAVVVVQVVVEAPQPFRLQRQRRFRRRVVRRLEPI
jgi:hypothetical protein